MGWRRREAGPPTGPPSTKMRALRATAFLPPAQPGQLGLGGLGATSGGQEGGRRVGGLQQGRGPSGAERGCRSQYPEKPACGWPLVGTKAFPGDNTPAHKGPVLAWRLPHWTTPGRAAEGFQGGGAGLGGPAGPRLESQLSQTHTRARELVPALCEPPFPRCEVGVGPRALSEVGAGRCRLGVQLWGADLCASFLPLRASVSSSVKQGKKSNYSDTCFTGNLKIRCQYIGSTWSAAER